MTNIHFLTMIGIGMFLLFSPNIASANLVIPVIVSMYPVMFLALIPVIIVEGYIFHKKLQMPIKQAMSISTKINSITTVIGFPFVWFSTLIISPFFFLFFSLLGLDMPSNLIGYMSCISMISDNCIDTLSPDTIDTHMLPIFLFQIVQYIFACFITIYLEYLLFKRFCKTFNLQEIKHTVALANVISYFLIVAIPLSMFLFINIFGPLSDMFIKNF